MDSLLPLVYNFVESIHFFIPLIAIVVCIVIFAFSTIGGGSKNQPPEEYLNEIRASANKNLAKSSKPKIIKNIKVSPNLTQKQASPKRVEEEKSPKIDVKQPEMTEKQRKKKEKQHSKGHKSDDEWITVTNSKQKKTDQTAKLASKTNSDIKTEISQPKIIKTSISDHEDIMDLGGKDSRYKKQNIKRRASEKGSPDSQAEAVSPPSQQQQEEFTTVNNARKRKTVRREN